MPTTRPHRFCNTQPTTSLALLRIQLAIPPMIPGNASATLILNRPNRDAKPLSLFLIHSFKPFSFYEFIEFFMPFGVEPWGCRALWCEVLVIIVHFIIYYIKMENMRVPELKALVRECGLRNYSQLRKAELIAFLQDNAPQGAPRGPEMTETPKALKDPSAPCSAETSSTTSTDVYLGTYR